MSVADLDRYIADLVAVQVVAAKGGDAAVDFDAGYLLSQLGQHGGLKARTRADFKYAVGGRELKLLGQPGFNLWRQHGFVGVVGVDEDRKSTRLNSSH